MYELILGVNIYGFDRSGYSAIRKKIGIKRDGSWSVLSEDCFDRFFGDRGHGISGSVSQRVTPDEVGYPVDYWYGDCSGDPQEDECGIEFESLSIRKKNALIGAINKQLPLCFSVPAYGGCSSVRLLKDSTAQNMGVWQRHRG